MRTQEGLVEKLKKMRIESEEIKTAQKSGASNVFAYNTETVDTWDVDWTPVSVGGLGYAQMRVTAKFTADNQVSAFTALQVDVYTDDVRYSTENQPFIYYVFDSQQDPEIENAQFETIGFWLLQVGLGNNVKMKFRAVSTDTGTLEVTDVIEIGS